MRLRECVFVSVWDFWQTTHARARTYIHERECARTCVHTQDIAATRRERERTSSPLRAAGLGPEREKERETHTQKHTHTCKHALRPKTTRSRIYLKPHIFMSDWASLPHLSGSLEHSNRINLKPHKQLWIRA